MSNKKYRISRRADTDLDDIWIYTVHRWSKKQADQYLRLILNKIEFVATNFYTGKAVEHNRVKYRVIKIKSHLIYYRRVENDIIEIVRILHQRMEIPKQLQ